MEKSEQFEIDEIDFRALLNILLKWKWLIVGITLLAIVTSGVLSFLVLTPVYQSKTVLMVNQYQDSRAVQQGDQQDDLQSVVNSLSSLPQMTIDTYVGQIKNEALMRKVIDTLQLNKAIYSPNSLSGLITIQAVPDTNLIEITVKNNDPQMAAKIANTVADEFIKFVGLNSEKKLVLSTDFLTKQLADTNQKLSKAQNVLKQLKSKPRNAAYLQQEVANTNQNLASYQNQLLQVDVDYQEALAGKTVAEQRLVEIPKTLPVKQLNEQGQMVEVEQLNPAYSDLAQTVAQKAVVLAEQDAKKKSIQTSLTQLQNDLKNLQTELNTAQEAEDNLQEQVDQIKQTRDVLSEKLTQVQIVKSVNLSQASLQVVTPAFPQDHPISPKKTMNMAIALVLGLLISVALAFVLELMNTTITKVEDIDQNLGLPVLGTIPLVKRHDLE